MKQNDTLNKQETGNTPAAVSTPTTGQSENIHSPSGEDKASDSPLAWLWRWLWRLLRRLWPWSSDSPRPIGTTAEVAEEEHPTPPRPIGTTAEVAEEEEHPTPPHPIGTTAEVTEEDRHPADSKTSKEWYQMYITAVDEAKNVTQYTEREIQAAKQFAIQKFAFSVFDTRRSLQDAIAASELDEEAPAMVGLKITLKGLEKTLRNNGVTFVTPAQGDDFDADMHEAVEMVHTEGEKDNTIAIMLQEGFSLNGRLVRPAIVKVYQTSTPSETGN